LDGTKFFLSLTAPPFMEFFKARVMNQEIAHFFMNVVRDTMDYREKNHVKRKDFLDLLIQLKNVGKLEDDEPEIHTNGNAKEAYTNGKTTDETPNLSFEQIAAQSFLFFIAGFETSSTLLTFCLYELSVNADIQDKLRTEIGEILEKHGGDITYDGIMDMKYMDNVLYETMRKYPPVPALNRKCTEEYNLPEMDLHVPKGTKIFIPIQGIQNDPKHYPNPEKFDPDRFTEEGKKTRHPYTWLPFGEGPRICIGLRFGMMQAKVALTVLIKHFKFTINEKTQLPFKMDPKSIVSSVKGGVWLNSINV